MMEIMGGSEQASKEGRDRDAACNAAVDECKTENTTRCDAV